MKQQEIDAMIGFLLAGVQDLDDLLNRVGPGDLEPVRANASLDDLREATVLAVEVAVKYQDKLLSVGH